ncbi:hypothetical protein Tco_1325174, partial [Tanacetum coccineum]
MNLLQLLMLANTANVMWIAIEGYNRCGIFERTRCNANLFWEFGKLLLVMQFQLEVNDIRAERIAKSANPLALMGAQHIQDYLLSRQTLKDQRQYIFHTTMIQYRSKDKFAGWGHRETSRKPKRVKDYAYHKEKMMMCKQAEQGVPLQAEQADWLEDTDEEIDEQELEAHYSYMAKIQEVSPEESSSTGQPLEQVQNHDESNVYDNVRRHSEQPESINDTYVLEKDDSNVTSDSSNICTNDNQADQNVVECVNERDALANLTLDTEENKTILKQLKKANASVTQELEKCKTNLDETNSALKEAISCRDSCLIALQNKQNEFEKYKAFNDRMIYYEILQTKLNETLRLLALKDIEIKEGRLKENTKFISDIKVKEDKDIDKMIEMDKQLKFLNEIVYTRKSVNSTNQMLRTQMLRHIMVDQLANTK